MNESLVIGDLNFTLRRSERRKTIGLTVERDGALILSAPVDCPSSKITSVVLGKSLWIYTKLAEKERLFKINSPKQYVKGEGFYYLGRSYRLMFIDPDVSDDTTLRLSHGRFILRRDERHNAEQHFINWYISHGQLWLPNKVSIFSARIGVTPKSVTVRNLGFRWGSCSPLGRINFHYRIMQLPPRIIEYIVVHELVHLCISHHGQEFWKRIRMVIPDYLARRKWLAENGGSL